MKNAQNEVPRLTPAQMLEIRTTVRDLSEDLGRTITPNEVLSLLISELLVNLWEVFNDDGRVERRKERRIAALARLSTSDEEAFDRAMVAMTCDDLEFFGSIGHKDPAAAARSKANERRADILAHSTAA